MSSLSRRWVWLALLLLCVTWPLLAAAQTTDAPRTLRVCAHPDNLPFSAQNESGFDNRIARIIADELHARIEFVWFQPQHGLVRKTLREGLCDALIGLPQGYEGVAASIPYYRSRYVFVTRRDARTPSFDDPAFLAERIGIQVIGDDMAATPPAMALAHAHAPQVVGFPVYGDTPAVARMVQAIVAGDLDAGIAWGPAAGYFAALAPRPLAITAAVAGPSLTSLPFEFAMVVAVRRNDESLKAEIDRALSRRRADIDAVLAAYHVPRTDAPSTLVGSCSAAAGC